MTEQLQKKINQSIHKRTERHPKRYLREDGLQAIIRGEV